jgi:hypothetical protein
MFSEIVARVCCLAPQIDRFDCMFMTNCAWLAMLSLVYMALLTLAAIRYNEYSLSGNSLHRCHACDAPPLIADKMFSDIVARVCCLAPAIDRFDCMFMTNCAWLAMLSLVYMALLTLAAIRYNEYSLSGNSLHRCHACDAQVDVLLALEFLSSNIVCVRHGGRHSTCEAGSQRRCPTEVLT